MLVEERKRKRNVRFGDGVSIPFTQAKVDEVNDVRFLAQTNHKIVRLHIAVNKQLGVEKLDSEQHFLS